MVGRKRSLICGIGVNDADYVVHHLVDGVSISCPYYSVWCGMLRRCYDKKYKMRNPTYTSCEVCNKWLTFSNFKRWMEQQEWEGKQLDKDLLVKGNKVYSETTCVFLDPAINVFLSRSNVHNGKYKLGVFWHATRNKFRSSCNNGQGKSIHLGYFDTEIQAHLAWKNYKHMLACRIADTLTDVRIANALRVYFLGGST